MCLALIHAQNEILTARVAIGRDIEMLLIGDDIYDILVT